jgi:hypothetical protein
MRSSLSQRFARPVLAVIVALQAVVWNVYFALAQEGGGTTGPSDVDIDANIKTEGADPGIFGTWWVWVLIAVFLIIVIALTTRSRGRSES